MTNDNMSFVADPLIIEIFLYRNNYKDRILIAEMKERAQIISMPNLSENSFFIQVDEVDEILHTKFRKDISDFAATSQSEVSPSVTSIYFIDSIIQTFRNLKYIKVNISDSQVYSRKVDNKVNFAYRIVHSRVDLPAVLTDRDFSDIRQLLIDARVYKPEIFNKKPYIEIYAKDLMQVLDAYSLNFSKESEETQLIAGLYAILGQKIEIDNPILLIIVEK